ncbi:hypothetical protein HUJ04_010818 [Dendroctonus ponderosae]|nr:hypothetical protein HUJ04_010818 [Dendroctonus ponderosae]
MNLLIHFTSNMFGCYDHYHTILETPISTSVTCTLQSTTAHRLSKRVKWDGIGGDSRRGSVRLLRQSKEMKYSIGEILENVLTYGPSRAAGCSGGA